MNRCSSDCWWDWCPGAWVSAGIAVLIAVAIFLIVGAVVAWWVR